MSVRPRPPGQDQGISSIIGFITAMVVLVASTAAVAYFIASQPDPTQEQGTRSLQSQATRALDAMVSTPGQPADWETQNLATNPPSRIGLLQGYGSKVGDYDKVEPFKTGAVDHQTLLNAMDLRDEGYSTYITGRIMSNPLLKAPGSTSWGVVNGTHSPGVANWTASADSVKDLNRLCDFNPKCPTTNHTWEWDYTRPPSKGLGTIHTDNGWDVEHQLVPQMVGIQGTYVMRNAANGSFPNQAAENEAYEYWRGKGGNQQDAGGLVRWRVLENNVPYQLPQNSSVPSGSHVFGVAEHKDALEGGTAEGSSGQGTGLWRVRDGTRAIATIGPYDISDADSVELSFENLLQLVDAETGDGGKKAWASILFWNTSRTPNAWTRVNQTPDWQQSGSCNGVSDTGWSKEGVESKNKYSLATVNLCEALQHSDGTLWLTFFWDSFCAKESGQWKVCNGNAKRPGGWFMDDLQVNKTVNGQEQQLFFTNFEPSSGEKREALMVSSGVDHGFYQQAQIEPRVVSPFETFVEGGGNVLALEPGQPGDWLGHIGLEATATTVTDDATAEVTDIGIMQMPNELPAGSTAYAPTSYGWSTGTTTSPTGAGPPTNQLTVVHRASDGSGTPDPNAATLVTGVPFSNGGRVTAISYDLASVEAADAALHADLLENLYASIVFNDPTFDLQDREGTIPKSGDTQVASTRRVLLMSITDDDQYSVPMEITLYLWPVSTVS